MSGDTNCLLSKQHKGKGVYSPRKNAKSTDRPLQNRLSGRVPHSLRDHDELPSRPLQNKRSGKGLHSSRESVEQNCKSNLTKWSYYHDGDVEIPEICVYSIDNRCSFEKEGCLRLHAKCTSQWQIMYGGMWCNLRNFHSKEIETAFEDASNERILLSTVNPTKLGTAGKDMFKILGYDQWEADFESMRLEIKDPTGVSYKLRRLSTQSSTVSKSSKATTYVWYFLDVKNKWIMYGDIDSTDDSQCISTITSGEIEKNYMSDKSMKLNFSTPKFQYILDMESMEQINVTTKKVRPVRRRPLKKVSVKKTSKQDSVIPIPTTTNRCLIQDLPVIWDDMKSTDTIVIVTLDPTSKEYQDVSKMLLLTLPNKRPVFIKRIQNPFLWIPFQNKKNELLLKYGSEEKLNVQKLFHGTRKEYVDHICKENFDWRLHGTNAGQMYGRGTYFSNSAALASKYCNQSEMGHCCLLVAEVIVGEVTVGNSGMARPPKNPATNNLYDTTVDNPSAPKKFVKYDKQEYYPLYIVEFK